MKIKGMLSLVLALSTISVAGAEAPYWTYEGQAGPEHWSQLTNDFHICHEGKSQSPINIIDPIEEHLQPLNLYYLSSAEKVINNGHTIQVTVDDEDTFVLDGEKFILK